MSYNNILLVLDICSKGSEALLDLAISIAKPYGSRISIVLEIYEPELFALCDSPTLEGYKNIFLSEASLFYKSLSTDIGYPTTVIYTYSTVYYESVLKMQSDFDLVVCSNCYYDLGRKSELLTNGEGSMLDNDVLIYHIPNSLD